MDVYPVSDIVRRFHTLQTDPYVFFVSREDMFGHRPDAGWAVNLQRLIPFQHPRGEDEIGIPGRVIGVEVGYEKSGQPRHLQPLNPCLHGG